MKRSAVAVLAARSKAAGGTGACFASSGAMGLAGGATRAFIRLDFLRAAVEEWARTRAAVSLGWFPWG
jgi:hypothetical protein